MQIRATEDNGLINGEFTCYWVAEIYSNYAGCFVPINASPKFDSPLKAISWGLNWAAS